jgi:hypothetical protein
MRRHELVMQQERDRWWTLVNAVINLRFPWNVGNFLIEVLSVFFSGMTLLHGFA